MIADMRAKQENEQLLREQVLNAAQAELMARQQEAEQQGSRLKEAAVSFSPFSVPHISTLCPEDFAPLIPFPGPNYAHQ